MLTALFSAVAPTAASALYGHVENQQGVAISGARIQILSPVLKSAALESQTNEAGGFAVTGLPAGIYLLIISCDSCPPEDIPNVPVMHAGDTFCVITVNTAQTSEAHSAIYIWNRVFPRVLVQDIPLESLATHFDDALPVIVQRSYPGWDRYAATDKRQQLLLLEGIPCNSALDDRPLISGSQLRGLAAVSMALPNSADQPLPILGSSLTLLPRHGLRGRNGFLDIDLSSVVWQSEHFDRQEFQWAGTIWHRDISGSGGQVSTRKIGGTAGGEFGSYDLCFSGSAQRADTGETGGLVNPDFEQRLSGWLNVGYLATPINDLRFHVLLDSATSLRMYPSALSDYKPLRHTEGSQLVLSRWQHWWTANQQLDFKVLVTRARYQLGAVAGSGVKRPDQYNVHPQFSIKPDPPWWEDNDERSWTFLVDYTYQRSCSNSLHISLLSRSADVCRIRGVVGYPSTFPENSPVADDPNIAIQCDERSLLGGASFQDRLMLYKGCFVTVYGALAGSDYSEESASSLGAIAESAFSPTLTLFASFSQREQLPPLFAVTDVPLNSQSGSRNYPSGNKGLKPERMAALGIGARFGRTENVSGQVCWTDMEQSQLIVVVDNTACDSGADSTTYANRGERAGEQTSFSVNAQIARGVRFQLAGITSHVRGNSVFRELMLDEGDMPVADWPMSYDQWGYLSSQPSFEAAMSCSWQPPERSFWPELFLRWRGWRGLRQLTFAADGMFHQSVQHGHHEVDLAFRYARAVLGQREITVTVMCANLFDAFSPLRYDMASGEPAPVPFDPATYTPGRQVRVRIDFFF